MTTEELDHIKKIYDRIDKIKDDLIVINRDIGKVKESVKDNKIDDLMTNEGLQKEIKKMASKQGRNTVLKWGAGLVSIAEIARQLMDKL